MSKHFIINSRKLFLSATVEQTVNVPKLGRDPHVFRSLFPWKTLPDFSNHIFNSIVYHKDGVIALNKPYGVKIYKSQEAGTSKAKNERYATLLAAQEDFHYSIEETLPHLKKNFAMPDLTIVKSAERYTSGVVLLANNEMTRNCLIKSFNRAKAMKKPHLVHWAVTRGYPTVQMRQERVGIKFIDVEVKNEKQPILLTRFGHNEVLKKHVKPFLVEYRTISLNAELTCSMIEIAVSSTAYHFVRVYMSSRAASILGDAFYGSRSTTLFGYPTIINPNNVVAYDVQPLPGPMCRKLNLPPTVEGHLSVPAMLHLRSIILPEFKKKEDLCITAPLPPHFQWTCRELNLFSEIT